MTTKRVAIAEMEWAALDWAVAKCTGETLSEDAIQDGCILVGSGSGDDPQLPYQPTTDWSQCGPLIERYKVEMCFLDGFGWTANTQYGPEFSFYASPLIAACRAIVAAHNPSGYVDVPAELLEKK